MEIPKNILILVCDDHSTSLAIIQKALSNLGFTNVVTAENVPAGREILEAKAKTKTPVEFIICDWVMPGISGPEFASWLRTQEAYINLPFLLLTAQGSAEEIIDGLAQGISYYMLKPVTEKSLGQKMNAAWERHHNK